jgi:hypothetical protein
MTYKNEVRTSQETHYVSTTKPNRLMLFSSYLTGNILRLYYKDQPVNAV